MSLPPHLVSVSALLPHLGSTRQQYFGFIRNNRAALYKAIDVKVKKNKVRRIHIPHPFLKHLQQELIPVLEELYRPPASAHGFIKEKSIVSNAEQHKKKRCVLNLDLVDFFPTITRRRIVGLLTSSRYDLPPSVAEFIGHMVTYEGCLPQGAPTSPIVSNMIAARLDSRLTALAKNSKAIYTRYADDITFSSTLKVLPISIVALETPLTLGEKLVEIVRAEGFQIHPEKTRSSSKHVRQKVTGLTVNRFPNVQRKRVDHVRALLHDWKVQGEVAANSRFLSIRKRRRVHGSALRRYVEGQIAFIAMVRGDSDPVAIRLTQEFQRRLDPTFAVTKSDSTQIARKLFEEVEREPDTKRAGYLLENAMAALASADGILVSKPFRAVGNAIQVDGAIQVLGNDYWIECKWWKDEIGSTELQGVVGKLMAAVRGTRAAVVSRKGFTAECHQYLNRVNQPIIVIGYQDLNQHIAKGSGLSDLIQRVWAERVVG